MIPVPFGTPTSGSTGEFGWVRVIAAARPGGGAAGVGEDTVPGASPAPNAGWYVIEDDAGVLPDGVEDAEERADAATGASGVLVTFTADGATAFRALTQSIAERGARRPARGDPRLAVALDDQVVSLAAIDPAVNPGGLDPEQGTLIGDLGGEGRARMLARLIDAGPLPLNVRPAR